MKHLIILFSFLVFISCSETGNSESDNQSNDDKVSVQTGKESVAEVLKNNELENIVEEVIDNIEQEITVSEEEPPVNDTKVAVADAKPADKKVIDQSSEQESVSTADEIPQPTNVPLKPNHDKWNTLLKANVSSSGKVNYSGMKGSMTDLQAYVVYLESFATRDSWSRNEKLAYWINLYNAATVRLICQNYPISSITNLSGGKPWDQDVVKVGTKRYSLNDIENSIIRPRFKEARIHFAVNCAAKSCPPIMNSAFTAEKLSRQLQKQTTTFINGSANTIAADQIEISKIFDWYKDDFQGGDVIEFLNKYSNVSINEDATITYKEYNWDLNK
ncbi:MAG: DUF547 domain-containing protein [Crocinitomicaceae bacterium]